MAGNERFVGKQRSISGIPTSLPKKYSMLNVQVSIKCIVGNFEIFFSTQNC